MFGKLSKLMGGSGSASAKPDVPPPNEQKPTPVPVLTPFPLTGEKVAHRGYLYTTPSDLDFLVFRQLLDEPHGWTLRYEQNGMYSWDKTLPGESMRLIKCFGIFDKTPAALVNDLLHDPDYRIDWDQNRLDGYCVTHLTPTADIGYYAAKVSKPVTNRDFVNMRSWREIGDDEFVIMSTSVPHADAPPRDGCVRALVKVSGYLVRKWSDGGSSITYLSHSDPKGWVPAYFVNTLTCKLAPNVISTMRAAAARYPEWIEKQGGKYGRPWIIEKTPWPIPVKDQLHEWVMDRLAKGAAAPPPEVDGEAPPDSPAESMDKSSPPPA